MGTKHRNFLGADLHRFGIWSDTDPAITYGTNYEDEIGVAPGLTWIEHADGDPNTIVNVWLRNAANTAWIALGVGTTGRNAGLEEFNEQTGTTYSLVLTDAGKHVGLSNAAAITLTVPTNASVAFPVGTTILLEQVGAGQVTITPAGGVTIHSAGGKLKTSAQYAVASLVKRDTNTWLAFGNLST